MADAKTNKDQPPKPTPRLDEFVSKIVTDPKQPPNVLSLFGYLGASSQAAHIRLYFDPQLSDWIDIPEDAILFSQAIHKEQSPLGGSLVWIMRDAEVIHAAVGAGQLKAKFLEGRIQRDYLEGRLPGACGTTPGTPRCPTPGTPLCPSPGGSTPGTPQCPPTPMHPPCFTPATPLCHPSVLIPCQTPGTPQCPSPCSSTPGTPQ